MACDLDRFCALSGSSENKARVREPWPREGIFRSAEAKGFFSSSTRCRNLHMNLRLNKPLGASKPAIRTLEGAFWDSNAGSTSRDAFGFILYFKTHTHCHIVLQGDISWNEHYTDSSWSLADWFINPGFALGLPAADQRSDQMRCPAWKEIF